MNGYIAFFKGKRLEIHADSLHAAKTKAVEAFKPSKRDAGLVSVTLAERDGVEVTHSTASL